MVNKNKAQSPDKTDAQKKAPERRLSKIKIDAVLANLIGGTTYRETARITKVSESSVAVLAKEYKEHIKTQQEEIIKKKQEANERAFQERQLKIDQSLDLELEARVEFLAETTEGMKDSISNLKEIINAKYISGKQKGKHKYDAGLRIQASKTLATIYHQLRTGILAQQKESAR